MYSSDMDKDYVSPYDKFLFEFDAKHEKSKSQLEEIRKYQHIFNLRDNAKKEDAEGEIWGSF